MTIPRLPLLLLTLAAGIFSACSEKDPGDPPTGPAAPALLQAIARTASSITLNWEDRSGNETGFNVYRRVGDTWSITTSVGVNTNRATIGNLQPLTAYRFRVTAYNSNGESNPSNEVEEQTSGPTLPNPPTNVAAVPLTAYLVRVTWVDRGNQDSFLIQRREPATAWTQVGSTPDNVQVFADSNTAPLTRYFYRVGAFTAAGTAWSVDSADVTTPTPGAPLPPESLRVETIVGTGVRLNWLDRSSDETYFHIGRNLQGQVAQVIDSVPAGITTYLDTLGGQVGYYFYRVRSVNQFGVSAWTSHIAADYRYCSAGVVPICIGNYWEYEVDTVGTDYVMRRQIVTVAYPLGIDFYLMQQARAAGGTPDSLYFLRNFNNQGCMVINHPLPSSPSPELWFRYPPGSTQDFYYVQGDCMKVVNSSPSTVIVGDTIFTGVISYQRFFTAQHSIQYFVRPNDVGIVQELEYISPTSQPVARNLRRWQVLN